MPGSGQPSEPLRVPTSVMPKGVEHTSQLADDLAWLEKYGGGQPGLAVQAVELRLAAALVRNCIGPFLDGQPPVPLHVAVVGGAGAGKSTVANLLTGSGLAESN